MKDSTVTLLVLSQLPPLLFLSVSSPQTFSLSFPSAKLRVFSLIVKELNEQGDLS